MAEAAAELLGAAEQAMAREEWPLANRLMQQGLTTLGEDYALAGVIDETGSRLILADAAARKQALSQAAHLRFNVLRARIDLMRQKIAAARWHQGGLLS
jgi:hypothetical protein